MDGGILRLPFKIHIAIGSAVESKDILNVCKIIPIRNHQFYRLHVA